MGLQKHQCEHVQELAWKNTRHVLLSISLMPVFLLVRYPSVYWAILSPAHGHLYACIHTQETALAEDWTGFMNQWPGRSFSDTEAGHASFPPCCCDTPRDLSVSGREDVPQIYSRTAVSFLIA